MNFNKLEELDDRDPYFLTEDSNFRNNKRLRAKDFNKPKYSYSSILEATKGLTIALNDIWASEVLLKQVIVDGNNYTAKYVVTLWDHFGLDLPDMQHKFNTYPSIRNAFACWFVLQHLRGYRPFLTKITFSKEFKGVL